jgi:hypothetical protein
MEGKSSKMKFLMKQGMSGGSGGLPHWIGAGVIVLALMLCLLPQAAGAAVPQIDCRFYGKVEVDNNWVAPGTDITAWLNDNTSVIWTAKTFTDGGESVYRLDIPPAGPKSGGTTGDIVRFKVRYGDTDYQAAQTGVWESGGFIRVNLAINTTTPAVATLTGQPTGWVDYETATITVGGQDVGKYKYKLDTGDWSTTEYSVSQPIELSGLSEGWHTLYVIGGNAGGWQPEDFPTEASWGVDTTPPPTPSLESPVNGVRINDTTPTFTWTPVEDPTGVSYWLRVDDNRDFSSPLWIETSFTAEYTVPDSNPLLGSYYWTVKAVDGAGKPSDWSTAWFFIVETEVETPLLMSPADGTTSQDSMPTFSWNCGETDGVSFILEIGNSDFSSGPIEEDEDEYVPLKIEDITGLTYTLSAAEALADGTYYWHVKTVKDGQESGWSEAWSITIETVPPIATITGAPSGTVNYTTADITVGGEGIVAYKYKLDDGAWSVETPVATHIILSGLSDGLHTVLVIGKNSLGSWQAESAATTASWTVSTTAPVAALSGQPSGTVNYSTADITVGGTGVVAYSYKLDSGAWSDETAVSTHIILSGLSDGAHTVSVIGKNSLGNWQAVGAATTASWTVDTTAPSVPTLLSPANEAKISDRTPTLDWSDVTDASGVTYSLQIDDNADFSSPIITKEGLTASTYTLTDAEALSKGTYYWRVKAVDGVGSASGWTAPFSLTQKKGEAGGCGCGSSSKTSTSGLVIGLGIMGLCWGTGYYFVRRVSRRSNTKSR